MKKTARSSFLAVTLLALGAATACTKNKPESSSVPAEAPKAADAVVAKPEAAPATVAAAAAATTPTQGERVVHLYIWANYTSPEILSEFTAKTGIKVVESNYASNEELLAKLQAGATGYDIAVPSDYMVSVMGKLGLLETLDKGKVPNLENLDPAFTGKAYDPGNTISLPYAWTTTGIAVNKAAYSDPVTSWADLLDNPKAAGRISMLDDVREAMAAALKLSGASLNATKPEELQRAKETLLAAKKNVKTFNSSPIDAIVSGEVALAHMYGQEAMQASRETGGKVQFVIPKEGGTLAIDNLVLLKSAPHKEEAYQLMNFLLEVKNNVDFVKRVSGGPVLKDTRGLLPVELQSHPGLFPPADVLSKCEMMQDLGDVTAQYDRIWSEIKVSSH
jgi:spermidine/putrescine transport system substrate-binding protein